MGRSAYETSVEYVEDLTSKCDEYQCKVLEDIISRNIETEYLKRYDGLSIINRESFKTNVPIITYEDIKLDILRIYNGDHSPILCAQPIAELWLSSGTSDGQRKLIPTTNDDMQLRSSMLRSVMPFIKGRIEGEEPNTGKAFTLLLTKDEIITPGGLLARQATNSVFKDPRFYKGNPNFKTYTSPIEAIHCPDHIQSIYTQLLCGFYQRLEVTSIKVIFGSSLVWAIHFLKANYSDICHDISSGTLSPRITDASLRTSMVETFMQPQPELAKFLEETCGCENWEGILKKIWPNTKNIEAVVTGSMAQYIPTLDYYSGGLPLLSLRCSSSECDLGFNLNPLCDPNDVSYTLMPNMAYYEFLPLDESLDFDKSDQQPQLIDMANVEVGQHYEIVVTTYSGLYRYRMGDILCPIGFYNTTPQFKFVRRRNVVLSIEEDKTTESELHKAIEIASSVLRPFDVLVLEYTSNAFTKNIPGHYVIYMELMTNNQENRVGQKTMEECCLAMEESLGYPYRSRRANQTIGPLEIKVVSNGTFDEVRDNAISGGASYSQFKMPRCVKSLLMLELLDSRVVSTHFSPSVPHCRP